MTTSEQWLKDVYAASLSSLQYTSPFLNSNVVNTNHKHVNEAYYVSGEMVKYDVYDCINFPVQISKWVNFLFETNRFDYELNPSDFMAVKGLKQMQRFSEEIQKSIVRKANTLITDCIDLENSHRFIYHAKSSIIASPNFIEDNANFFDEFFKEKNQYSPLTSWHIAGNGSLDVYVSDMLADEEAILFHDGALMVPFSKVPDMHPFPSERFIDQGSGISFRLATGCEFGKNFKAYAYDSYIGVGIFPGEVLRAKSKKITENRGLVKYDE